MDHTLDTPDDESQNDLSQYYTKKHEIVISNYAMRCANNQSHLTYKICAKKKHKVEVEPMKKGLDPERNRCEFCKYIYL